MESGIYLANVSPRGFTAGKPRRPCRSLHKEYLNDVRSGSWGLYGAVDPNWVQVTNLTEALEISYQLCLKACGTGMGDFDWK